MKVANRGKALSECVILKETLDRSLRENLKGSQADLAERFIAALTDNPRGCFPVDQFCEEDKSILISQGYLTLETHVASVTAAPGLLNNVAEISTPILMAPELHLSLPSLGSLLRLYSGARVRLNDLIPSGKIVPWERLKSRWNSERGRESSKIKKWKEFCGLRLEIAIGIAVGEGSLELVRICGGGGLGLKGRWKHSTVSRRY